MQLRSALDEFQNVLVETVLIDLREAMPAIGIDFQSYLSKEFFSSVCGCTDGNNLVVITVHDQDRDVDFFQILCSAMATTRSPKTPRTLPHESTTASVSSSRPMGTVDVGCE